MMAFSFPLSSWGNSILRKKQIKQQKLPYQTTINTKKPKSPDSKSHKAGATDIQTSFTEFLLREKSDTELF